MEQLFILLKHSKLKRLLIYIFMYRRYAIFVIFLDKSKKVAGI